MTVICGGAYGRAATATPSHASASLMPVLSTACTCTPVPCCWSILNFDVGRSDSNLERCVYTE